ncbi:MAG: hypothetical protein ACK4Q5_04550, partial [Saprospiraceae bacterium]
PLIRIKDKVFNLCRKDRLGMATARIHIGNSTNMQYFKYIPPIRYESPRPDNPLAFKFYDPERVVAHLKKYQADANMASSRYFCSKIKRAWHF